MPRSGRPHYPATGGSGTSRITSVDITDVTSDSITLSLTALLTATRFQVFYTTDGILFLPVPPPTGQGKTTPTCPTPVHPGPTRLRGDHAWAHLTSPAPS